MTNQLLLGRGKQIIVISQTGWENYLAKTPQRAESGLEFMTDNHFRIRNFLVTELPRVGEPISVTYIAQQLSIPLEIVEHILNELEKRLFFLVRDEQGAVVWAFPITAKPTPHHLRFSTGEMIYAA